MRFPRGTPKVVRKAVRRYVRDRRSVMVRTVLFAGLALAGLVALTVCVLDRYVELSNAVRVAGPIAVAGILCASLIAAACASALYRPGSLRTAIRLDTALRENADRWATSLDLLRRRELGQPVGAESCVERLLADTADGTDARPVRRLVRRGRLVACLGVLAGVCAGFLFLQWSAAFDLGLLWTRFCAPHRNLPRDSAAVVDVRTINDRPCAGVAVPPLPEDSPFSIVADMGLRDRRLLDLSGREPRPRMNSEPGTDDLVDLLGPPQMELLDGRGEVVSRVGFQRWGRLWRAARPRLTQSMSFCVRVGDARTAVYHQEVVPRIAIVSVDHSVWFPRYARLTDIENRPLTAARISLLKESRIELHVACNSPYEELTATFEPIQEGSGGDQPRVSYGGDYGEVLTIDYPGRKAALLPPRRLRVRREDERTGRLRMLAEQSGILRIRARAASGVESLDWICMLEAVEDRPPRITISGVEPDTTIIPGELVAVDYRIEDDFGVADALLRVMDTDVQSQAKDRYLPARELGGAVVEGQEVIQRMDYTIYRDWPLTFQFLAWDYKGQEARSREFRIHLRSDEFLKRFNEGMAYLEAIPAAAAQWRASHEGLGNRLNVVVAAVADAKTWPPGKEKLLAQLERTVRGMRTPHPELAKLRYGDVPDRLVESGVLLSLPVHAMHQRGELLAAVNGLQAAPDLPAAIADLRAMIEQNVAMADAWQKAARAEVARFLPESVLQNARRPALGLAGLERLSPTSELYAANRDIYMGQIAELMGKCKALAPDGEAVQLRVRELADAHKESDAIRALAALRGLMATLQPEPVPSGALLDLAGRLSAAGDEGVREHLTEALTGVLAGLGDRSCFLPLTNFALAGQWTTGKLAEGAEWYYPPVEVAELNLVLDALRSKVRLHWLWSVSGRYAADARQAGEAESELRELALGAVGLTARCAALDEGQRQAIVGLLNPFTVYAPPGQPVALDWAALDALEAYLAQAAGGKALRPHVAGSAPGLDASLDALAGRWEAHAAAVRKALGKPSELALSSPLQQSLAREAAGLQASTEAVEMLSRSLLFVTVCDGLVGDSPQRDWARWRPLFDAQREIALATAQAAQISADHAANPGRNSDWAAKYSAIAGQVDALAQRLRTRGVPAGPPAEGSDRALYLDILEREFRDVAPFLLGGGPDEQKRATERLANSEAGRGAVAGSALLAVARCRDAMRSGTQGATAGPASELKRVQPALAALEEPKLLAGLRDAERALTAAGQDGSAAGKERLARVLDAFAVDLDETILAVGPSVHPPPLGPLAKKYGYGQMNWLRELQDSQVALLRETAARAVLADRSQWSVQRLVQQYARLVELRARGIYRQGRVNRPLDIAAEDVAPAILLPAHIAAEFFKARTQRPPDEFRYRIEDYYDGLYRDLAE